MGRRVTLRILLLYSIRYRACLSTTCPLAKYHLEVTSSLYKRRQDISNPRLVSHWPDSEIDMGVWGRFLGFVAPLIAPYDEWIPIQGVARISWTTCLILGPLRAVTLSNCETEHMYNSCMRMHPLALVRLSALHEARSSFLIWLLGRGFESRNLAER